MPRPLFVLLAIAALLTAAPLVADEPADPSLLERLSAETERLAARADAQSCVLVSEGMQWGGVIVGEPARLVVAFDDVAEHGALPREGKVTMSGGSVVDARLLDGDRELGLAIYALTGGPWTGLKPAAEAALRRGALALSGGGTEPALVVLGRVGGPLDDVHAADAHGVALMAPGGRLLGLRDVGAGGDAQGCAACHTISTATSPYLRTTIRMPEFRWGEPKPAPAAPAPVAPAPVPPAVPALDVPSPVVLPGPRLEARLAGGWSGKSFLLKDALVAKRRSDAFVPAPVIERALADLAQGGRLQRPYLGIVTEEVAYSRISLPENLTVFFSPGDTYSSIDEGTSWSRLHSRWYHDAHALVVPTTTGVRLASVLPDSPAAKAGLEKGAEILELDGRAFAGARGFARALARRRPGEEVRLTIKGAAEPVRVVLGDREKDARDLASAASVGLTVLPLTPDLVAFLELHKDSKGVVVRTVEVGSAAAAAGLQRGDAIFSDGQSPVRDAGELDAVLGAAKGSVVLRGRRQGVSMEFTLTLPDRRTPRKTR